MTTGVLALALDISVAAVSVAMLLCVWRLVRGPQSIDRVLAVDTLYLNTVALVLLLGMRMQTQLLFEAALIVAMLGFAATVGLARYISRGDVKEVTAGKPKAISKRTWDAIKPLERIEAMADMLNSNDDEEEALLMLM